MILRVLTIIKIKSIGSDYMRITSLELANAVIANQEEQINELLDKIVKLESKEIKIKFEHQPIEDVKKEYKKILNVHETKPSCSRDFYYSPLITRKPNKKWYEFWK